MISISCRREASTVRVRCHAAASESPAIPIVLWLPASKRSGIVSGWSSSSLIEPVPPSRVVAMRSRNPGRM